MNVTFRRCAPVLSAAVIAVAGAAACTTTVPGSPLAGPERSLVTTAPQTTSPGTSAAPSPTSPRTTTTPTSPRPGVPPVPTRTTAPGPTPALAETTCDEYIALDEASQRAVISAVGQENSLVSLNPELWVTLTSALCTFAAPDTTVREVLEGQGIR